MNGGLGQMVRVHQAVLAEHGVDINADVIHLTPAQYAGVAQTYADLAGSDDSAITSDSVADISGGAAAADGESAPRPQQQRHAWNAQPCLGYPSRSAAAWALRQQGLGLQVIADRVGCKAGSVHNLIRAEEARRRRQAGYVKQPFPALTPGGFSHSVRLSNISYGCLCDHAERRGMKVIALVRAILDAVIKDDLVDAVLDDGAAR